MKCRCFNVSDLNRRIIIENRALVDDGIGGFTESWEVFAITFAKITPLAGNELLAAAKLESRVNTDFIIRYRHSIPTADMRISYFGNYYDIKYVIDMNDERKYLMIRAMKSEVQ